MWRSFIQYCKTNGGCYGEKFTLDSMTDQEHEVQDELNSILDETPKDFKVELTPAEVQKSHLLNRMKDLRNVLNMKKSLKEN